MSNVCKADAAEEHRGPKHQVKNTNPWDVLNAFDMIHLFLGECNDDSAMDHFLHCEGRAVTLLQGKARRSKLTDLSLYIFVLQANSLSFLCHSHANKIPMKLNFFTFPGDFIIAGFDCIQSCKDEENCLRSRLLFLTGVGELQ